MNNAAWFAIGWFCLAITGLGMMATDIARSRRRRAWPTGLLLAGIAYAALNAGVFVLTISADAFAIFEPLYIAAVGFVAPAAVVTAAILFARVHGHPGRPGMTGFATWIGCVGFAHLFVIAAASASV